MTTINLIASEIAKLTGHNRFEDKSKTLNNILSRNKLSDVYVPKSNIEDKLLKLDVIALTTIKKELKLPEHSTVKDIELNINKGINKSYNKDITEKASKVNVDSVLSKCPILKKQLCNDIKKDLQMKRGNIKEEVNLNKTQTKSKIIIRDRNSQMYTKTLYKDDECIINIRGKVDGISEDKIIETKNRTKRLFKNIPGYEKVQLEAYMFLTGLDEAIHIECYNEEQIQTHYKHNEAFWTECIDKVIHYVKTNIKF